MRQNQENEKTIIEAVQGSATLLVKNQEKTKKKVYIESYGCAMSSWKYKKFN